MASKRNYSIDMLRCILMIMIIIHHTIVHAFDLKSLGTGEEVTGHFDFSLFLLNSICIIAVNAFFFISGYYSIKLDVKKIVVLFFEMQFYSLIWYLIMLLVSDQFTLLSGQSIKYIVKVIFPIYSYWFMGVYLLLCILAPFVNDFIRSLDKSHQIRLLIILTSIAIVYGFVFDINGIGRGYTFIHGLYMYFVGTLCSNYISSLPSRKSKYFCIYIMTSLVVAGIAYFMYSISLHKLAWIIYSYNNPLIIIGAVCISILFVLQNSEKRLVKAFSKISKFSLSIYLITDFDYARKVVFWPLKQFVSTYNHQLIVVLAIITYAVLLFCACIIVDIVRVYLFSIIGKLLRLRELYESICNRCRRATRI